MALILVTSHSCPACWRFMQTWPSVKEQIAAALPDVDIIHVEFPTLNVDANVLKTPRQGLPQGLPIELQNYVKAFPSFIFVDANTWSDVKSGARTPFHATVYGTVKEPSLGIVPSNNAPPMTAENIIAWVRNQTSGNIPRHPAMTRYLPARGPLT